MKARKALAPLLSCTLAAAALPAHGAGEARPFPQHTVYTAGTIKPKAQNQAALDRAVRDFYRVWKAAYLRSTGEGERYVFCNAENIFEPKSTRSVSEGHGYGMLAAVLMAGADPEARADFDGLFRFYRAHPSEANPALMAWRQVAKGSAIVTRKSDRDSATDGDLDIACALLMADLQWGGGGPIAYRKEAQKLLVAIQAAETDSRRHTLTLGSWVDTQSPQWGGLRPSDFMPAHWKTFAAAAAAPESGEWTRRTDATYRVLGEVQAAFSPRTGLQPDFVAWEAGAYRPAPAGFLEGPNDGAYGYNACRVPWRLGTDYLLTGDPRARALLAPLNAWVVQATGGDPGKLNAGYRLDGAPLQPDSSAAFVGPLAVAAMADPARQAWLDALWADLLARAPGGEDYYGNSVKLLTMIVLSGNWWQPLPP
ncbi:MAG: glycosyl hydrolase family 8 [Chthoniobacteraceae bacterium]|nr:glycosyl hydrolase family 8 [Chthoniobacteraceae bacterium]